MRRLLIVVASCSPGLHQTRRDTSRNPVRTSFTVTVASARIETFRDDQGTGTIAPAAASDWTIYANGVGAHRRCRRTRSKSLAVGDVLVGSSTSRRTSGRNLKTDGLERRDQPRATRHGRAREGRGHAGQ